MLKTLSIKFAEQDVQTLKDAANLLLDLHSTISENQFELDLSGVDMETFEKLLDCFSEVSTTIKGLVK